MHEGDDCEVLREDLTIDDWRQNLMKSGAFKSWDEFLKHTIQGGNDANSVYSGMVFDCNWENKPDTLGNNMVHVCPIMMKRLIMKCATPSCLVGS